VIGLRPPTARELSADYGGAQDWLARWRGPQSRGWHVETERVGGRLIGVNDLPARAVVADRESLWRLLGVRADVEQFLELQRLTTAREPRLREWVDAHPLKMLAAADIWERLLAVITWIEMSAGPSTYLRQIDVAEVDTKFVETHRVLLGELLDEVLPPGRIDVSFGRNDVVARYRLARKPAYVRFRRLDGQPLLADDDPAGRGGPSEVGLRVDDAAQRPLGGRTVIVVENEMTYLALPPVDDALAVLGGGYAVSLLASLTWLGERQVFYWGDLDTHGFRMLDRFRAAFPRTRSLLMDCVTLLDHEAHWGQEPTPVTDRLPRLTPDEESLYRDLVEDRYRERLRLEQERIRFGAVRRSLAALL
jgi:hypothetical protein